MTDINKVILVGRVTRDIGSSEREFAYTAGGTARLNISIACNESVKSNGQWDSKPHFFDVTIWGKTAENLKQYMAKGKQVAITGRLKQDRWTDQQSGQNRTKVYINAEEVQLLGGKSDSANGSQQQGGGWQQQQPQDNGGGNSQDGGFPEDIPF